LEERFRQENIRLFKYANKDYKVQSIMSVVIIARLVRYILNNKIEIVHTHNFSGHIWGVMAAKLTGRKIVEHVHDFRYMDPEDFKRRRGFNRQYRFVKYLKNTSDFVAVLTKQNVQFLIKTGLYPRERIIAFPNGISLPDKEILDEDRRKLRNELGLRLDQRILLTPVRLAPEKNVDLVLRIASKVVQEVPNTVFLIAGDGPLLEKLMLEVDEKGLKEAVRFIGFHPDIKNLLKITDILLLPSFLELHSIALLEAMSMKVPAVISNRVGCHDEFIQDWKNGVLLDPFSDEGWAEAVIKLLKNPELKQEIGSNGYKTCLEKFNIKDVAKKFEALYANIVS
jgi:glycosyltransferase involved in cell wall biosynthesis